MDVSPYLAPTSAAASAPGCLMQGLLGPQMAWPMPACSACCCSASQRTVGDSHSPGGFCPHLGLAWTASSRKSLSLQVLFPQEVLSN